MKLFVILLCWQMALLSSLSAQESSFSNGHFDLSGELELEQRTFLNNPLYDKQKNNSYSASLQLELSYEWDDGLQSLLFVPFYRYDLYDTKRSHADLRELYYQFSSDEWEFRLGLRKVFWGVTESMHLVDVINQTDLVESSDGEEKFGQPMINAAWIGDWGTLDFFIMPYFRERSFPGEKGRLRGELTVEDSEYESSAGRWHTDFALRFEKSIGDVDLGISYFYGTSREPRFELRVPAGEIELVAVYDVIHQGGIDIQYTKDAWLWKYEMIVNTGKSETYTAFVAGLEYTFYDIRESGLDVGLLAEYLYDSRGTTGGSSFQNDLFLGTRLSFNDTQSTELLAGAIADLEGRGYIFSVEASRRLGDSYKVSLEIQSFQHIENSDSLYGVRNDDYILLSFTKYF